MQRLTEVDIRRFAADFRAHAGAAVNDVRVPHVVAAHILGHLIGAEWVLENVFGKGDASAFLRSAPGSGDDRLRHQDRVLALADVLFNLQDTPGAEARMQRVKREDVESLVAELEAAKLLIRAGHPVRFIEERGTRGADYDIETTIGDLTVACETKCKIENTALSPGTITNVLKSARGQLPASGGNIVFVKIPENWVRDPAIGPVVDDALTRSFRGTTRISAVVFHWEEWLQNDTGQAARVTRSRVEHNRRAKTSLRVFDGFLKPVREASWQYIIRMLGECGVTAL